jgi:hypothetical protein
VVAWQNGKWEVTHNVGLQTWGSTIDSSSNADMLSPGVAGLAKLYTGAGKHIGKKFFGMLTENVADLSGNLTGAGATKLLNGVTTLLAPYSLGGDNLLLARVLNHVTGVPMPILEVGINGVMAYQRRRRPGTGT